MTICHCGEFNLWTPDGKPQSCGSPTCDHQTLSESLAELERTDPAVAEAAARYDATVDSVLQGRVHPLPCTIDGCEWHTEPIKKKGR